MPIVALILLMFFHIAWAEPFPSQELRQLWDVPTVEVTAETVRQYDLRGVRVEEVYYQSRPYKGKPVRIFGYFAYPRRRNGKLPAILLSHGGGGTASLVRAAAWAKRGYAVLTIDLPGKGEQRAGSRSTGPDMDLPSLLRTQPDPSDNYLVHAVAAARNGITYLTQREEVDPERIGMIGLSWGGVLTLLTNGQDSRLKAAVNIFGAGHIPEGCTWEEWFAAMPAESFVRWNALIDPKIFLASQHAPVLFISGTNDHCYYLPTFQKSYQQVTAAKCYYLVPNLRHRFLDSSQGPALAWLDQELKGPANIFPRLEELPVRLKAGRIIITVLATAEGGIGSARLYYAAGGPQRWTAKKWLSVPGRRENGAFHFALPASALAPEVLYFASFRGRQGAAASSLVRSLFKVKLPDGTITYAVSAPIRQVFRHEKPFTLLNGAASPEAYLKYSNNDGLYVFYTPARRAQ